MLNFIFLVDKQYPSLILNLDLQKDVAIGRMPIMLRSSSCVLYRKDEEELAWLG